MKFFNSFARSAMIILVLGVAMGWLGHLTWVTYQRRSAYQAMLADIQPYQNAVARCFRQTHSLNTCHAGQQGIPPHIHAAQHHPSIRHLRVVQGRITLVPRSVDGIRKTDTYVLEPHLSQHQQLEWHSSGGGVENGFAN